MKKPTVAEITGVMNCGGAELMLMNILRRLHNDFHFVFVIVVTDEDHKTGEFDDEIRALGAELVYIESMRTIGIGEFQKRLTQMFRQMAPDVAHCHLNSKCGVVAKCAHEAGVAKIISHSHARLKFRGNPISAAASYAELYWERGMINRYSTDFWGCSADALRSLYTKKNRHSAKSKIVYNLIDGDRFTKADPQKTEGLRQSLGLQDKLVLGVVGRIAPVKNHIFAVDVLAQVLQQRKDAVLLIVGAKQFKDYTQTLFAKIQSMGLEKNVVYLPPRKDIECVYPLMDICLGTSIREGASLTAIEAQLSGCYTMISPGYLKLVDLGLGLLKQEPEFSAAQWAQDLLARGRSADGPTPEARRQALIDKGFDLNTEIDKIKAEYAGSTRQ